MADVIQNQTISPSSSNAESTITMNQSANKTDTSLTAPFNTNATSQTDSLDATAKTLSTITMAQSSNKTDTSLTADFNTQFVSAVVFDINLLFSLSSSLGSFEGFGTPIVFYARTAPEPIIFYTKANADPIVFYALGTTQRAINKPDTGLSAPFNYTYEQGVPTPSTSVTESTITMDQTQDKTDTSLTADFSTAVA